jgi:hypothetical protein
MLASDKQFSKIRFIQKIHNVVDGFSNERFDKFPNIVNFDGIGCGDGECIAERLAFCG